MKKSGKFENHVLFMWGCLVGIACFVAVYGIEVLDVTYDAWIFHADIDLRQHYLGWCHFRTAPWQFPIGLIDSLSYPHAMSVLWTDSIPAMALLGKLFRTVLPETFQYFGWFVLVSFGLQGGISAMLIRKITDNIVICLVFVCPFVLSFPILQRTFYHTSLCAHWIILLALYLWFSDIYKKSTGRKCMIWALMGVLCVMIHSYFLPMTGIILGFCLMEEWMITRKWKSLLLQGIAFCSSALIMLYILGAFYGNVSSDYSIGGFESNLNTLYNSMGQGRLLKGFSSYGEFQYEGFGYLGAGMILLVAIGVLLIGVKRVTTQSSVKEWMRGIRENPRKTLAFTITVVFFCISVLPYVTLGDRLLFKVPYPDFLNAVLGIFRSNGRFIWPAVYLLMLTGIYGVSRFTKREIAVAIIIICVVIQLYDTSFYMLEKRENFAVADATYKSFWDRKEINDVISEYDHFVITFDDVTMLMNTASYAYGHDMTLNRFYYARNNEEDVKQSLTGYLYELAKGKGREDCIYVFNQKTYELNSKVALHFYSLGDVVIGTKKEIRGLDEIEQK